MLAPMLVSCGNGESVTTVPKVNFEQDGEFEYSISSLPELDMNKEEFGFFGVFETHQFLDAEEETGDIVKDSVFQRKLLISEKYNVKFNMFEAEHNKGVDMIKNLVLSGDTTYHVYQSIQRDMGNMIKQGYFLDWNDLVYVDYTKPYWNGNITKTIEFGDKVYQMAGDLNIYAYNKTNCLLFNKEMFDDLGIDYPYQDVYDKTWTIDKLIAITKQGYADLNGSSQWEFESDRVGYSGWSWEMDPALFWAMGGTVLSRDEDNMPVLNIKTEHNIDVIDKMIELFDGKNGYHSKNAYADAQNAFKSGRLLVKDAFLYELSSNRDSEFPIGIVPYPMYDEEQESYVSRLSNISHLAYIPTTNRIHEQTGIILEAFAIEGYNKVRPTYYDITLDLKSMADTESADMVDMIIETASHIPNDFLPVDALMKCVSSQTNTFSSILASKDGQHRNTLKKLKQFYSSTATK